MKSSERTKWVVERARALGFDLCGVAPAAEFEELQHLPEWLARGYAGEMGYLQDSRRSSPARVLERARSLVVCALNYNTSLPYSTDVPGQATDANGPRGWISRYAWGEDYHAVLLEKLEALAAAMRQEFSAPFEARAYVDTGPVVERVAAKYAGLGWLAKNTCLINPELGSWLFLGVIVTTLELEPSLGASSDPPARTAQAPPPDLCGNCRLCLEACPTGALVEPYLLDARRCISYLTIELRGAIPVEFREAVGRQVFGCDICQDVCPWNRQPSVTNAAAFYPRSLPAQSAGAQQLSRAKSRDAVPLPSCDHSSPSLFAPPLEWLASLSEDEYRETFRGSAVRRAKWRGLVRNACVALGNVVAHWERNETRGAPDDSQDASRPRILALLERLAVSQDELIAEHARWALDQVGNRTASNSGASRAWTRK